MDELTRNNTTISTIPSNNPTNPLSNALINPSSSSATSDFEEKGFFFHLKIRVYGIGFDETYSHGYCVDDTPLGTSHPIGELYVDIRTITWKQLRPTIQYNRTGHMDRRSKMFQEALFIMERLRNTYDRPKDELKKYSFGWIHKTSKELTLVRPDQETLPIVNVMAAADIANHDLALVPWSQIAPGAEF